MGSKKVVNRKRGTNLSKLTDKQRRFVDLYLADANMNASKAAKEAGYTGGNASAQLMANPDILAAIGKATTEISERTKITQDDVVRELASLGFSNIQDYIDEEGNFLPLQDLPRELAASIYSVEYGPVYNEEGKQIGRTIIGYNLYDKLGPLNLLGRHLGLFDEKLNIGTTGTLDTFLATILDRVNAPKQVITAKSIKTIAAENP